MIDATWVNPIEMFVRGQWSFFFFLLLLVAIIRCRNNCGHSTKRLNFVCARSPTERTTPTNLFRAIDCCLGTCSLSPNFFFLLFSPVTLANERTTANEFALIALQENRWKSLIHYVCRRSSFLTQMYESELGCSTHTRVSTTRNYLFRWPIWGLWNSENRIKMRVHLDKRNSLEHSARTNGPNKCDSIEWLKKKYFI